VRTKKPLVPSDTKRTAYPARSAKLRAGKDGLNEAFEYASRKGVRNNPIVREVDDRGSASLWKSIFVSGFLVLVLLVSSRLAFELAPPWL